MSYREQSPEVKVKYREKSRELWGKHKEREAFLRSSGMEYTEILKDAGLEKARLLARQHDNSCPTCGGTETHMENYNMMWHDGDIVCTACNTYIRMWDAG